MLVGLAARGRDWRHTEELHRDTVSSRLDILPTSGFVLAYLRRGKQLNITNLSSQISRFPQDKPHSPQSVAQHVVAAKSVSLVAKASPRTSQNRQGHLHNFTTRKQTLQNVYAVPISRTWKHIPLCSPHTECIGSPQYVPNIHPNALPSSPSGNRANVT